MASFIKKMSAGISVMVAIALFGIPFAAFAQTVTAAPTSSLTQAGLLNLLAKVENELTLVRGESQTSSNATSALTSAPAVSTTETSQATSTGPSSNFMVIQTGDQDVAVTALQEILASKGFLSPTHVTGYFGSLTQAGVKAFQAAHNLPRTGVFTVATSSVQAFFAAAASSSVSAAPTMGLGASGPHASSLQSFLIAAGYLKIPASTGYFGSLTQSALKSFQAAHNLPQTGVVDQATFSMMNGN